MPRKCCQCGSTPCGVVQKSDGHGNVVRVTHCRLDTCTIAAHVRVEQLWEVMVANVKVGT